MGLNFLIPDRRRRVCKLRRERSSASACAMCSSSMWGDQWPFMARARKSSRLVGKARKPICCRSWERLFVGVFVVTGEFIVSLQIVRFHIDGLRLGVATEVYHHRHGGEHFLLLLTQQKGNGRGARSVAFYCLTDGTSQGGCTVEV